MKIIVVDDEKAALTTFLMHIVDELSIEYKMFLNDPVSAVEYIKNNKVDAAFLDISMEKINGVDLAEQLIKIDKRLKIVFITGYSQKEDEIRARLNGNLKAFCYKPYNADELFMILSEIKEESGEEREIFIRTFDAFDLLIDKRAAYFSCAKSKELLALLVQKNGAYLLMGEAISQLWPDKNAEQAKILYRDAVWRLRQGLKDYGLEELVSFSRAQQIINKNYAKCDYWDFLDGKNQELYSGIYMPNYDWSIETQNKLDIFKNKN